MSVGRGRVRGPSGLDCLVVGTVVSGTCAVTLPEGTPAALVAATNIRALARWADRNDITSDDDALAPAVGDDHGFEEIDPAQTSGTDPPRDATLP